LFCGHFRIVDGETAKEEILEGQGVYRIVLKKQPTIKVCSFESLITEKDIQKLTETMNGLDVDQERSYITRWNEKTEMVEFLFGSKDCVPMD
jgi:hypothetical protein